MGLPPHVLVTQVHTHEAMLNILAKTQSNSYAILAKRSFVKSTIMQVSFKLIFPDIIT